MTQSSERSPSAQEGPSSRLAAPATGGQGVGTCPDCGRGKKRLTFLVVQAFLDAGYGVLLGVALSLAAFIYAMDVVARNAQGAA